MHDVYFIMYNNVLEPQYLSCETSCCSSVCVLWICVIVLSSACVVAFWSFMADACALWQTNYVFNVEQMVFFPPAC